MLFEADVCQNVGTNRSQTTCAHTASVHTGSGTAKLLQLDVVHIPAPQTQKHNMEDVAAACQCAC